jgi:hypothetical protein
MIDNIFGWIAQDYQGHPNLGIESKGKNLASEMVYNQWKTTVNV